MTKKECIEKTVKAWERKIKWVIETQNRKDIPNEAKMLKALRMDWHGKGCSLCDEYYHQDLEGFFVDANCKKCPLYEEYNACSFSGYEAKKNNWYMVQGSLCWKDWIKEAKIFLKQIKSLLRKS